MLVKRKIRKILSKSLIPYFPNSLNKDKEILVKRSPGLRTWISLKQKGYFKHESQVCVSAVHPDMMYNHDNWDYICYFCGHFVLQFCRGKTKYRAWHGADLESAYPNCVKTTAWQILLRNALQTMPLFEKWALTTRKYNKRHLFLYLQKIYFPFLHRSKVLICHSRDTD